MKPAPYNLLLQTASCDNILTLTTACSTACIFCSHHQNPPGVEAYYVDKLSYDEVMNIVEFLDKNKKVVIGESATRICEGEPFLYPQIIEVLKGIRKKFKGTIIQVTTSGVPLSLEMMETIKNLGKVELNISLNSCTVKGRSILYGGKPLMQAVEAVKAMQEQGIVFSGSIVAEPQLVGLDDIKETIGFLSKYGAQAIRVFIPGYTKYSKLQPPSVADIEALKSLITEMRKKIAAPITLDPEMLTDLEAKIAGVIEGSPAHKSGMELGDIVVSVDGENVFSRVDAYYKLLNSANPEVTYKRNGVTAAVGLAKLKKEASGLVFSYDLHPDTIDRINKLLGRYVGVRKLLLTSELAFELLYKCIDQDEYTKLESVHSDFFGGNIACAGLLTLQDIALHLQNNSFVPQMILLPSIMFDQSGRDLAGKSYMDAAGELGVEILTV